MNFRPPLPPPVAPTPAHATTQHVPTFSFLPGGSLATAAPARPPTGPSLPVPVMPTPPAQPPVANVHATQVPSYGAPTQQVMPQPAMHAYPSANPWGATVLQHAQLAYLPSPPPQPYAIVQYEGETLAERLAKNMLLRGAAAGCWELTQFLSVWPWAPSRK